MTAQIQTAPVTVQDAAADAADAAAEAQLDVAPGASTQNTAFHGASTCNAMVLIVADKAVTRRIIITQHVHLQIASIKADHATWKAAG